MLMWPKNLERREFTINFIKKLKYLQIFQTRNNNFFQKPWLAKNHFSTFHTSKILFFTFLAWVCFSSQNAMFFSKIWKMGLFRVLGSIPQKRHSMLWVMTRAINPHWLSPFLETNVDVWGHKTKFIYDAGEGLGKKIVILINGNLLALKFTSYLLWAVTLKERCLAWSSSSSSL